METLEVLALLLWFSLVLMYYLVLRELQRLGKRLDELTKKLSLPPRLEVSDTLNQ